MSSLESQTAAQNRATQKGRRKWATLWTIVLFLLPTLVFLMAFTYWPLITSIWHSFQLWTLEHSTPTWTGLANYRQMFSNPIFIEVLRNTAIYVLIAAPLSIALALAAALAVNGSGLFRQATRALIFYPVLLPTVAIAAIWLFLLNPVSGPLPRLLSGFLGYTPNFLADPNSALATVALVGVYKNTGLYMLFFLAGLQSIPRNLTDAARIDGAGSWRVFRYITWPLLGPVTFYITVIATLDALRNVDHIFVLTQGGPANATNVFLYQIFLEGFNYWNTGHASALTVLFAGFLLLMGLLALPRLERGIYYEA